MTFSKSMVLLKEQLNRRKPQWTAAIPVFLITLVTWLTMKRQAIKIKLSLTTNELKIKTKK